MTDKQFKDAFTAAGGWFFLTQYRLIDSLKDNRKELLDKLFEKHGWTYSGLNVEDVYLSYPLNS